MPRKNDCKWSRRGQPGFAEGLEEIKRDAAERWVRAVNGEGSFGVWNYRMAKQVSEVPGLISAAAKI